jgi:hypothetical protein
VQQAAGGLLRFARKNLQKSTFKSIFYYANSEGSQDAGFDGV